MPVFIPDTQLKQSDPNLTVYEITLSFNAPAASGQPIPNVLSIQPITIGYVPSDLTQTVPPAPTSRSSSTSPYYWVQNVSDWVAMINTALQNAPTTILQDISESETIGDRTFTFNPPFVSYDISTGVFSIYKDINVDTRYSTSGRINLDIMFNARLYNILPFPAVKSSTGYTINTPRNLETHTHWRHLPQEQQTDTFQSAQSSHHYP